MTNIAIHFFSSKYHTPFIYGWMGVCVFCMDLFFIFDFIYIHKFIYVFYGCCHFNQLVFLLCIHACLFSHSFIYLNASSSAYMYLISAVLITNTRTIALKTTIDKCNCLQCTWDFNLKLIEWSTKNRSIAYFPLFDSSSCMLKKMHQIFRYFFFFSISISMLYHLINSYISQNISLILFLLLLLFWDYISHLTHNITCRFCAHAWGLNGKVSISLFTNVQFCTILSFHFNFLILLLNFVFNSDSTNNWTTQQTNAWTNEQNENNVDKLYTPKNYADVCLYKM